MRPHLCPKLGGSKFMVEVCFCLNRGCMMRGRRKTTHFSLKSSAASRALSISRMTRLLSMVAARICKKQKKLSHSYKVMISEKTGKA